MKKIIAIVAVCGAVFCTYKSGALPTGSSGYRVEYSGTAGTKFIGTYGSLDFTSKTPMRMEQVQTTLPHTVSFNPPAGATVSAAAAPLGQGSVTIKIFKNGIECGQPAMVGSAAMANMVCQP
jgi:hypothetical protein